MGFLFLPEAVVESLPPTGSEIGKLFVTSKMKKKRQQQSRRAYGTDYYLLRPYGTTWGHSLSTMRNAASLLGDWLDMVIGSSSPQDSPASHSALPGNAPEPKTAVMAGLTPFALLEKYDPSTPSSKTCQDFFRQEPLTANAAQFADMINSGEPYSALPAGKRWLKPMKTLFGTSEPFSETWPKSGMMRNGECYPHPTWAHRTKEIVSGYAHTGKRVLLDGRSTLPTPTCSDAKASYPSEYAAYAEHGITSGNRLRALVVYATPNTMDALPPKSAEALDHEMTVSRPGRAKPANLRDQIGNAANWRTLQAGDIEHGGKNSRDSAGALHLSAQAHRATAGMWSPPHASDLEGGVMEMRKGSGGHYKLRDQVQPINASLKRRIRLGKQLNLSQFVKKEASSGKLNPYWGEWLMGWPIGWTSLEPLSYDVFMDWLQKTIDGTWWDVDPADVGEMKRLETGIARHKARWMQIGNGQVSLTAAVAEEMLNE